MEIGLLLQYWKWIAGAAIVVLLLGAYEWHEHVVRERDALAAESAVLKSANAANLAVITKQRADFMAGLEQVQQAHETWVAEVKALAAIRTQVSNAPDRKDDAGDAVNVAAAGLRERRANRPDAVRQAANPR